MIMVIHVCYYFFNFACWRGNILFYSTNRGLLHGYLQDSKAYASCASDRGVSHTIAVTYVIIQQIH